MTFSRNSSRARGLCSRGLQKGRLVIAIHDAQGKLVAYAGRAVSGQDQQEAKYKFPPMFRKSLEVFNLHGVLVEGDGESLILAEGFFDVLWLWQGIYKNAVASMGSEMSEEQESKIVETLGSQGRVTLLFDGDPAGQRCTDDVLGRLVPRLFVKMVTLRDGQHPDGWIEPNCSVLSALLRPKEPVFSPYKPHREPLSFQTTKVSSLAPEARLWAFLVALLQSMPCLRDPDRAFFVQERAGVRNRRPV